MAASSPTAHEAGESVSAGRPAGVSSAVEPLMTIFLSHLHDEPTMSLPPVSGSLPCQSGMSERRQLSLQASPQPVLPTSWAQGVPTAPRRTSAPPLLQGHDVSPQGCLPQVSRQASPNHSRAARDAIGDSILLVKERLGRLEDRFASYQGRVDLHVQELVSGALSSETAGLHRQYDEMLSSPFVDAPVAKASSQIAIATARGQVSVMTSNSSRLSALESRLDEAAAATAADRQVCEALRNDVTELQRQHLAAQSSGQSQSSESNNLHGALQEVRRDFAGDHQSLSELAAGHRQLSAQVQSRLTAVSAHAAIRVEFKAQIGALERGLAQEAARREAWQRELAASLEESRQVEDVAIGDCLKVFGERLASLSQEMKGHVEQTEAGAAQRLDAEARQDACARELAELRTEVRAQAAALLQVRRRVVDGNECGVGDATKGPAASTLDLDALLCREELQVTRDDLHRTREDVNAQAELMRELRRSCRQEFDQYAFKLKELTGTILSSLQAIIAQMQKERGCGAAVSPTRQTAISTSASLAAKMAQGVIDATADDSFATPRSKNLLGACRPGLSAGVEKNGNTEVADAPFMSCTPTSSLSASDVASTLCLPQPPQAAAPTGVPASTPPHEPCFAQTLALLLPPSTPEESSVSTPVEPVVSMRISGAPTLPIGAEGAPVPPLKGLETLRRRSLPATPQRYQTSFVNGSDSGTTSSGAWSARQLHLPGSLSQRRVVVAGPAAVASSAHAVVRVLSPLISSAPAPTTRRSPRDVKPGVAGSPISSVAAAPAAAAAAATLLGSKGITTSSGSTAAASAVKVPATAASISNPILYSKPRACSGKENHPDRNMKSEVLGALHMLRGEVLLLQEEKKQACVAPGKIGQHSPNS